MNEQQAFGVLLQALTHANKMGAFELKDSATIFAAIGVLSPRYETAKSNGQEELPQSPGPHFADEAPKVKSKK